MLPKNGTLSLGDASMDYIRFGSGKDTMILLPGLGDGLKTVKGTALPMSLMYSKFGKAFTVYGFSRRDPSPEGVSTRDMAQDVKTAMEILGIQKAHVFGVSMGGMIAQHLAIDYPEAVEKLVLAVTCSRPNPTLEESIKEWEAAARTGDHAALMDSNLRRIYSPKYYRQNKGMIPLLGLITKPKSYDRFFVLSQACMTHNAFGQLSSISCPTLVVGGEQDIALGCDASRELAAKIPGARLHIYPQWGHGLYKEEPGFDSLILDFFTGGA